MINKRPRRKSRKARHARVRRKVSGTPECPRLAVYKSGKHIYAQLIDDLTGRTLASASTNEKGASKSAASGNASGAKEVGTRMAERALGAGVNTVVFDRTGYRYHGRVRALADAAREGGLKF